MAKVVKVPVAGRQPSCANRSRLVAKRALARARAEEQARKPNKPEEFVNYDLSEDEDEDAAVIQTFLRTSYNFADYLRSRELNLKERKSVCQEYPSRHMISHELFKEFPVRLQSLNKVFCSQWLSDRQIMFGTKCYKLMVYDVNRNKLSEIPLLRSGSVPHPAQRMCGIHSIRINPSKDLLVTSASNPNDLAVYRLPTMEPICVGEAHNDWIFDFCWLDDQFLVSGSSDCSLGLWKVDDDEKCEPEKKNYSRLSPMTLKVCKQGNSIRALAFNIHSKEVAALSVNGFIHLWNIETFRQTYTRKLPSNQENVCIALKDGGPYGIGSRSYTLLLDQRTLFPIKKIPTKLSGCGVRSLSFQGDILTIGIGMGMLLFYDMRANKYLESSINSSRAVSLKCSKGYVLSEEELIEQRQTRYTPAIYTHCYDYSGTRIFTAGGPLPNNVHGNYAAIWQ